MVTCDNIILTRVPIYDIHHSDRSCVTVTMVIGHVCELVCNCYHGYIRHLYLVVMVITSNHGDM